MNKIKYCFAALAMCLCSIAFAAKGDIRGQVKDASGSNIAFATVAIYQADSTLVKGDMTLEDGSFSIASLKEGVYRLEVSLIGYRNASMTLKVGADDITLPAIILEDDAQALAAATVTERVPVIEQKIDKLVMNVAEAVSAQGSSANDILRKAPGVAIDKDGNITLNGQSVAVWIDGRPSHLSGRDLSTLLSTTDGTTIDKIEIMAHPSSKYDAQGSGGIINIKTKKSFLQGLNGSVNGTVGGMHFNDDTFGGFWSSQENGGASISYRTDKSSTSLNLSGYDVDVKATLFSESNLPGASQKAANINNWRYSSANVKLAQDWFLDKKNIVGVIFSYNPSRFMQSTDPSTCYTDTYLGGVHMYHQTTESRSLSPSGNLSANVNYTHTFNEQKAQEITLNADYNRYTTFGTSSQTSPYEKMDPSAPDKTTDSFTGASDRILNIYSFKADYQQVFMGVGMLEAGAKFSSTNTDNISKYEGLMGGLDMALKNADFNYNENIAALYGSVAMMFSPRWSAKAGLRGEATFTKGDWRSAGKNTEKNYFNVFPTLYVGYNPSRDWRYSLSYTYRIGRPRYSQLNPQVQYSDATTYNIGNPNLNPSFTHQLAFMVGIKQYFNVSLMCNYDVDMINQRISNPAGLEKMIRFDNLGNALMAGANISVSQLPITKWWMVNMNVFDAFTRMKTSDGVMDSKGNFFTGYGEFDFLFPKDWKAEIGVYGMSPFNMGYMTIDRPSWSSWAGVKKTMLENRLTLGVNVDDIFNSQATKVSSYDSTGAKIYSISQKENGRKILFSITYTFGKSNHHQRHRNVGNVDEMSRIGGGSSSGSGSGVSMPGGM